jgi:hypothetical protein
MRIIIRSCMVRMRRDWWRFGGRLVKYWVKLFLIQPGSDKLGPQVIGAMELMHRTRTRRGKVTCTSE